MCMCVCVCRRCLCRRSLCRRNLPLPNLLRRRNRLLPVQQMMRFGIQLSEHRRVPPLRRRCSCCGAAVRPGREQSRQPPRAVEAETMAAAHGREAHGVEAEMMAAAHGRGAAAVVARASRSPPLPRRPAAGPVAGPAEAAAARPAVGPPGSVSVAPQAHGAAAPRNNPHGQAKATCGKSSSNACASLSLGDHIHGMFA